MFCVHYKHTDLRFHLTYFYKINLSSDTIKIFRSVICLNTGFGGGGGRRRKEVVLFVLKILNWHRGL